MCRPFIGCGIIGSGSIIGIIAIIIMLCTMDMDYTDIWRYLKQAGIYFPLILGLWLVVYWVNTISWWLIINDEGRVKGLSF